MSTGMMHFAFLQILIGALVAGIDAGRNYMDWPLMAGGFFPPFMFELEPVWRNFFENDGTVQFIHRIVAYILFMYVIVVWRRSRQSGNDKVRFVFNVVVTATLFQAVFIPVGNRNFSSVWCYCVVGFDPMGQVRVRVPARTISTELNHDHTI
jgi:cytochrome c oxidase assembly protein subunit 15